MHFNLYKSCIQNIEDITIIRCLNTVTPQTFVPFWVKTHERKCNVTLSPHWLQQITCFLRCVCVTLRSKNYGDKTRSTFSVLYWTSWNRILQVDVIVSHYVSTSHNQWKLAHSRSGYENSSQRGLKTKTKFIQMWKSFSNKDSLFCLRVRETCVSICNQK